MPFLGPLEGFRLEKSAAAAYCSPNPEKAVVGNGLIIKEGRHMSKFFDIVIQLTQLRWQGLFQRPSVIKGLCSQVSLVLFDGLSKGQRTC